MRCVNSQILNLDPLAQNYHIFYSSIYFPAVQSSATISQLSIEVVKQLEKNVLCLCRCKSRNFGLWAVNRTK